MVTAMRVMWVGCGRDIGWSCFPEVVLPTRQRFKLVFALCRIPRSESALARNNGHLACAGHEDEHGIIGRVTGARWPSRNVRGASGRERCGRTSRARQNGLLMAELADLRQLIQMHATRGSTGIAGLTLSLATSPTEPRSAIA